MKTMTVKNLEDYIQVYRLHLINTNLVDDTNSISLKDLIKFVDTEIDSEDKEWYGLPKQFITK